MATISVNLSETFNFEIKVMFFQHEWNQAEKLLPSLLAVTMQIRYGVGKLLATSASEWAEDTQKQNKTTNFKKRKYWRKKT